LSIIAAFVAGANDFGTLSAMCQTSKWMLQECERTLYETVEWDAGLMKRFEEGKRLGQYRKQFDHIKCVVVSLYADRQCLTSDTIVHIL
jgi:hypothetical protein